MTERRQIPAGAHWIAPGIYAHDGEMHLDAAELLEANGYEPTPENQARLEAELDAIADAYGIKRC
jgi:hypothetical protein